MLYSVVVPVYNSEKSLELLYDGVKKAIVDTLGQDFELILVDDSSKDRSFAIMEKLRAADSRVKIVQMANNFGQHKALMCGFSYAKGDFIITMDDDLQHPPEEIPKLVEFLAQNPDVDVAIGSYDEKKHNIIRNIGSFMSSFMSGIMLGRKRNLRLTSFRLMRRYVVDALLAYHESNPRVGHLLLATTNRMKNVLVHHESRKFGRSGYTFKRLVRDFMSNLFNNSDLPLKLVGRLGLFSFFASILLGIAYLIRYFIRGYSIPGFATQVLLTIAFSGLTLFSLGIVGNYLLRVLGESKNRPTYVVRREETDD